MKKLLYFIPVALLLYSCGGGSAGEVVLATNADSTSYALGAVSSDNFKGQGFDISPEKVKDGIKAAAAGNSYMGEEEIDALFRQFSIERQMRQVDPSNDSPYSINLDTFGYAMGTDIYSKVTEVGYKLNADAFYQGHSDAFNDAERKLTNEQVDGLMKKFNADAQKVFAEKAAREAEENKAKGIAFLAEKEKEDGITKTESGLLYEVMKSGAGKKPLATDKVKVHYHGTLIDGTVFDSSVDRGTPIEFELNKVIPGWTEGVQLMPIGSKYKFYVPSNLAYGERGFPPKIGPGAALIFEVELIDIVK